MNIILKRLFDSIDYQLEKCPKTDMLAAKENGQWKTYSTLEVKETVNRFSAGLLLLGISGYDQSPEGADKIAIISNNRPEWIITDLAVQQTGAILVPLYPTTNPAEIEFILNDAHVRMLFVSSKELYHTIKALQPNIPSLQQIFSFDVIEGVPHWSAIPAMATPQSLLQLETIKQNIPVTHIATIIYTSGTTGTPKGVMLSHGNIYADLYLSILSFPFTATKHDKALSFLPLNHIFEKMITYAYLYNGYGIYYAESLETIGQNLQEIKPVIFTTVPRLLEKVYERILLAGSHLKGIKKALFYWSVNLAERYDNKLNLGFWYNLQLSLANTIIFKRWREALGGNIKIIATGGAACQVKLLRVFRAARINVYEGYGPTENSAIVTINRNEKDGVRFGTVGLPIEGIEVKLEADGEICIKGPTVMAGYYKQPELTAETIINGWLHTGDIGEWVEGRFLKITDRKKELFKTSGGKYVAPQALENKFRAHPFIEQIAVIGADKKFVSAFIVPSYSSLHPWMQENNIQCSNQDAVKHPKVLQLYEDIIASINPSFNHVEQIKKIVLLPEEWTIESGELTPKLSLRRKVIAEKYKDQIEKLYAEF
jgi:long-chain acyl-CoA synthetase